MFGADLPAALAAVAFFENARSDLMNLLKQCGSGKELIGRGRENDVFLASPLNARECVPKFVGGAYVRMVA